MTITVKLKGMCQVLEAEKLSFGCWGIKAMQLKKKKNTEKTKISEPRLANSSRHSAHGNRQSVSNRRLMVSFLC